MKPAVIVLLLLVLLSGCATLRRTTGGRTVQLTEVHHRTVWVPDTVSLHIPRIFQERASIDTASHLENDLAFSDASIDAKGVLHHSLGTKEQDVPVPVQRQVEYRDSLVYRDKEVLVPDPYPVEVPAALNAWQRFRLKSFWPLVGLAFGQIIWRYRKVILKFFAKIVSLFI